MAEACQTASAHVQQPAEALGHDAHIGQRSLWPGPGSGGYLPKDSRSLMVRAGELGAGQALAFLREADAISSRRRKRVVDLAREQCDGVIQGIRITVWGSAFKHDTDDIRGSPALAVAHKLHRLGGHHGLRPAGPGQRSQGPSPP
jgi:UDPglucose 6-dehydrogenase